MFRTGPWIVIGFMVAVVFAGCLNADHSKDTQDQTGRVRHRAPGVPGYVSEKLPEPVLKCFSDAAAGNGSQRCNELMTPDEGRQGNEVTIAVNPKNPKNIVGGAKDYYPADAGECVWDGVYVTHDAGATAYQDRSFDGSPWRQMAQPDPSKVNYATQFWCTTDPVAYFATDGSLYYVLMAYQADRVTGSKTGKDPPVTPPMWQGALNDWAFNRAVQIVARSDNGGDSFTTFTPTLEGSFPIDFHDKAWLAASGDGVVHIMWDSSLALGNTYMRSTDRGATFPANQMKILGGPAGQSSGGNGGFGASGQGSFLDVGPGKEVYASWASGGGITFRSSMDEGVTWDPPKVVQKIVGRAMPGLSDRDRRGGFPAMATDRFADSPTAGAIYFVWQDGSKSDASDILFTSSFDKGKTWTDPIILNDDFGADGKPLANDWQVFPTISVSPLGVIDVSWMDTRLGGTSTLRANMGQTSGHNVGDVFPTMDQFYTYSLDGGKTWSANSRVRDANDTGWDPQLCHHQDGKIFIGDYNDIDSSWGAAHPVWPDSRDGKTCKVYTATIQRPIFPDSFNEEKKSVLRQKLVQEGLVDADHPFLGR